MIIKFENILPNPHRDLIRNPLREETIEPLRSSVRNTGFWGGVAVRKHKTKKDKYELGYGHNRIEAAKREGLTEADFIVQDWDDSTMLKVKHKEDSARKTFDGITMIESVRAVVNALDSGVIEPFFKDIPKTMKLSALRLAPSFIPLDEDRDSRPIIAEKAYTANSIASFLDEEESDGRGGKQAGKAVKTALNALHLIEIKELSEASLKDVPLDSPDPSKPGLIQKVKFKVAQRETRLEATKAQKELAEVDIKRRAEEQKEKEKQTELLRQEREAKAEDNRKEAKNLAEKRQREIKAAEERKELYEENRATIEARVKEAQARARQAQQHDKSLPTRHAVKEMLRKLDTIVSERFAFREEVKSMARDKTVTVNERELIRQAMLKVSDWYAHQSNLFLGIVLPPGANVLKEAREREEAKRKRKGTDEQE